MAAANHLSLLSNSPVNSVRVHASRINTGILLNAKYFNYIRISTRHLLCRGGTGAYGLKYHEPPMPGPKIQTALIIYYIYTYAVQNTRIVSIHLYVLDISAFLQKYVHKVAAKNLSATEARAVDVGRLE